MICFLGKNALAAFWNRVKQYIAAAIESVETKLSLLQPVVINYRTLAQGATYEDIRNKIAQAALHNTPIYLDGIMLSDNTYTRRAQMMIYVENTDNPALGKILCIAYISGNQDASASTASLKAIRQYKIVFDANAVLTLKGFANTSIEDNAIDTTMIKNGAITASKIADDTITTGKIAASAKILRADKSQSFTDTEKAQARMNIGLSEFPAVATLNYDDDAQCYKSDIKDISAYNTLILNQYIEEYGATGIDYIFYLTGVSFSVEDGYIYRFSTLPFNNIYHQLVISSFSYNGTIRNNDIETLTIPTT